MTTLKLISAGLIVAATLTSPAVARESGSKTRGGKDAYAAAVRTRAVYKPGCVRAPDLGAYATAPWRKPPCDAPSSY